MRLLPLVMGMVAMAAGATVLPADPAGAVCSVFDRRPCAPTVCSVYQRRPCLPEIEYPIGQDLRLTIVSPAPTPPADAKRDDDDKKQNDENQNGEHKLDSIKSLFAALRGCWVPPDENDARPGMQMAVRLSFKRTGEIIGTPRVTYTSPDAPSDARETYHNAITTALEHCTPMQFSKGLGGAIAGRPIAIRFVDNRNRQ